jgi:hypothetical protein
MNIAYGIWKAYELVSLRVLCSWHGHESSPQASRVTLTIPNLTDGRSLTFLSFWKVLHLRLYT